MVNLPLTGQYQIVVTDAGFAVAKKNEIELKANESASGDVLLFPQGSRNEIIVTGTTSGVQADSAELGTQARFTEN